MLSPKIGLWDPFQMAYMGGDPSHLLSGMILQVGDCTSESRELSTLLLYCWEYETMPIYVELPPQSLT